MKMTMPVIKPVAHAAALSLTLAACGGAPAMTPPPDAAEVNAGSMSLAAQRFNQFCIASIGTSKNGVDLAEAYYKSGSKIDMGTSVLTAGGAAEGIGVVYDRTSETCIVSSGGSVANGNVELKALAEGYAARTGGTVSMGRRSTIVVKQPAGTATFSFFRGESGPAFSVKY